MSEILYEKSGAIVTLTLNRPDRMNAYNVKMHAAFMEALDTAEADKTVRVIVVTGAGRAFCAGAEIAGGFESAGLSDAAPVLDGVPRDYGGMLNLRLFDCDTPIIAAVNGHAVGIGATMLLPMDIKIASETSKFAFPFARRGIVFDGAASFFLPRIVGLAKTQEWILRGDTLTASEVLNAGMISEVVAPESVLERAMALAADIAENVSPESAARNKQLIRASIYGMGGYDTPGMSAHMRESRDLADRFTSEDCREGVSAFFEKRKPIFNDRT